MHVFFSGIGGTGLGPLALIAKQAGYEVSGSDKQDSKYIEYLREHGIDSIHIGQDETAIAEVHHAEPIDWLVYSSAVAIENPDAPELLFCKQQGIKMTKRDELLNRIILDKNLKLIAVAGTHGKTTTTAMTIWALKQLDIEPSYSVGAKISFGDMGQYIEGSEYFIYEADEYDHNFLAFKPFASIITGIDWDHADIYPTRESYQQAFKQFIGQCDWTIAWRSDFEKLGLKPGNNSVDLDNDDAAIANIKLAGLVNRQDAWLVANALSQICQQPLAKILGVLDKFPGVARRFEQIAPRVYSDYAHTPPKIRGALQMAQEVAGKNVVVVYEGLHNTRQHFIKDDLRHLFDEVKKLYVVPSYLAREDKNLELLTPEKLIELLYKPHTAEPAQLNDVLLDKLKQHQASGDLVLCLTAGGGGSLDEWLRQNYKN